MNSQGTPAEGGKPCQADGIDCSNMSNWGSPNRRYCYYLDGLIAICRYASLYASGIVTKTNVSAEMRSEY